MRVAGHVITDEQIAAMRRALEHELGDPRGHTWYNHVAARAVVYEDFPNICERGASVAAITAGRLLRREARAGRIRHIGGGKWQRIDPSPAAGEDGG